MPDVRVLLVDDYEPWRRCVSSILRKYHLCESISEVADGYQAVLKAQELKPDLVLLDISLPDLSGIETADRIRKATPGAKILFITAYNDPDALQTVLRNGADGYVLKWNVLKELVRAVEEVLCGRKFVSEQLTLSTTNSAPLPSESA